MISIIYIVVKDEGEYSDREVFNEAVFDSEKKAVDYILKNKGVWHSFYEEYEIPNGCGFSESYRIEKWEMNSTL